MARSSSNVAHTETEVSDDASTTSLSPEARRLRAETITKDHVLMATATGIVPAPGVDIAGGFAVQLALLSRLSKLYDVPYTENVAKGLVYSLLGSLGGFAVGGMVAMSAVKAIPLVGSAIGLVSVSVMMGASTYAVGKVFTQHFESGGTFLDFDASANKKYFRDMFKRGRGMIRKSTAENQNAANADEPDADAEAVKT